jgi:Mrp family chromosome partitioning ATPase
MKGHLDVPVLATLPYSPAQATLEDRLGKASRSNSLLLLHNPSSETSDGIRSLADKVPFLVAMASNNILLISSPGEAQGRTFTAANFAAACSLTRKVLLVDCNLSHPEIHNYFAVENVPGLSEAIIEPSGIKMAVKNAPDIPNLKIISAGTLPPNENNLLRHENFAKIITEQAAKFDLVVVDFPALNPRLITPQSIGFAGMVVMVSDGTNISRLRRVVEYYRGFGSIVGGIIINKPAVREKSLFSVLLGRG